MHWNAQGITTTASIIELELVLLQKQIDIICINETFLKANHKFKLKNFKVYREDRTTIKKSIPHEPISKYPTAKVENVSIIVTINKRFTSVYCANYTNNFLNDLNILTTATTDYIIFGDLNAHHTNWNCFRNNTAGMMIELFNHQMSSHYYIYSPNSFTRFGQTSSPTPPSVVDLLLTNSNLDLSQRETHPEILNSDYT